MSSNWISNTMSTLIRHLGCACLTAFVSIVCHAADIAHVQPDQINAVFADWDRTDGPGVAVGVFVDGRPVHTAGYGMANLDDGLPITPDSVFGTFSMAKSFTTACIAVLLDDGSLTLDDDVRQYLPELPGYDQPIRVRHLLRCQTGLQDYIHAMMLSGREIDDAWSKEDVFEMICRQKTTPFAPGESFNYSNTDFFLLGMIVERASGLTLREFSNRRLFAPLKMQSTFFDDDRSIPLKNRTHGYGRRYDGSYHRIGMLSSTVGPIGLKTTVTDLQKWDHNFHSINPTWGRYVRQFFSNGSLISNDNCLCGYGGNQFRGVTRTCQTGGGPGFLSHFVRFPEQGLSVAILSNLSEVDEWHNMERAVGELAQLYIGHHFTKPRAKTAWQDAPESIQLSLEQLQPKTGGYRKPDGSFVRLIIHDNTLALDKFNSAWPPPNPVTLTSLDAHRFRAVDEHVPFDLVFDEEQVELVTVRYRDGFMQKWKQVDLVSPGAEELTTYAGEYYCENLGSVHRFSIVNGQLFVQFNFGRRKPLVPATSDVFVPATGKSDNMRFHFHRGESGLADSFQVTFERVKYRFVRR